MAKYGKGKVYGKITDANGRAIKGVKVDLWDSDWPDEDDWMGKTYTDSSGDYTLKMPSGMDTRVPGSTSFRPDIYITASVKNREGRWVRVPPKSKTYDNHKLKNNKKINLKLQTGGVQKKRTSFRVNKHGFNFNNNFVVEDFLGFEGPFEMGFCGGMSAAALHRFQKGCDVPATKTTPKDGTKLHDEMLDRQMATLPASMITEIYNWQRSPDLPHTHTPHSIRFRQKAQWKALKAVIDKGKPAVLVLIREEGYVADMTKNHQVLAFGYEYNPTTRDLKVEVYDPNDDAGSNFLFLCLGGGRLRAHQIDSRGKRINFRGFLVNWAGPEAAKDCMGACTKTRRRASAGRTASSTRRRHVGSVRRRAPTGTHPQ